MIEFLAVTNFTIWLAVIAVLFLAGQTVFISRMLKSINSDAGDQRTPLPTADSAESHESSPGNGFRTTVATPRARKLQPAPTRRPEEASIHEPTTPAVSATPAEAPLEEAAAKSEPVVPIKPSISLPRESELAEPVLASAAASPIGDTAKDVPSAEGNAIPTGALILGASAPASADTPPPAKEAVPATEPKAELPAAPSIPAKGLPPLAVSDHSDKPGSLPKPAALPEEVPVPARKFFGPSMPTASLTTNVTPPPPAEKTPKLFPAKSKEETALPSLGSLFPGAGDANKEPTAAGFPGKAPISLTPLKPADPVPSAAAPKPETAAPAGIERAGDRLIAIGQPVKIAGDADAPPVAASEADDVKKKAPRSSAPEPAASGGLILIPPVESKPEPVTAKSADGLAETAPKPEVVPAAKAAEPVLSPAVADAMPAAQPAETKSEAAKPAETKPEAEAKAVKGPRVFLPGKFFGGGKSKDKEPVGKAAEPAPEAKPEPVTPAKVEDKADVPKVTEPATAPSLVVPPVEEVAPVEEKKAAEPVTAKADEKSSAMVEAPKAAETVTPAPEVKSLGAEVAKPEEPAKPEPASDKKPEAPVGGLVLARKTEAAPKPEAKAEPVTVEKTVAEEKGPEKPVADVTPAPEAKAPETPISTLEAVPAPKAPEAPVVEKAPAAPIEKPSLRNFFMPKSAPAPAAPIPAAPAAPTAKAPEAKPAEPVKLPPVAAEEKPATPIVPEHSLVAAKAESAAETTLPTQAGPTTEPIAEPLAAVLMPAITKVEEPIPTPEPVSVPMSAPAPAPAPVSAPVPISDLVPAPVSEMPKPEQPSAQPAAEVPAPVPTLSINKPQPVMPPNETTTSLPNTGRASAQLTLAFEITSLQLTPFFKLGSVQLKALSNVVSLHLVAAQADNPLAAGISFQIEHVDLDGSAHLKSILLKPLGESRALTAPLPKLQVDNVAVTSGGEGAPISVTTSGEASTAVQLFGTFTIAAMEFTPAFEIGSLRLEPNSNTVLLRVAPSSRPTALDLPPSFEIAAVQLGDGAQITGVRVTPSGAK